MRTFKATQKIRGDHRPDEARLKEGNVNPKRDLAARAQRVPVRWPTFWPAFWIVLAGALSPVLAGEMRQQASGFSLPALSGGAVGLEGYRGKVVLLNFWASWCSPCKEELPELERMQRYFAQQDFEVLGINIDKRRKNALKLVKRFGLSFAVLLDPEAEVIQRYPGRAMPISYLIDREGGIRKVFFGYNPAKLPQMKASIQELVNEKKHSKK